MSKETDSLPYRLLGPWPGTKSNGDRCETWDVYHNSEYLFKTTLEQGKFIVDACNAKAVGGSLPSVSDEAIEKWAKEYRYGLKDFAITVAFEEGAKRMRTRLSGETNPEIRPKTGAKKRLK